MTLAQIYKLINLVSLKENNGNLFKIYDMNNAIIGIDSEFLLDNIKEYEKYQDNPKVKQSVLAGKSINELITPSDIIMTLGAGTLPSNYGYFKSATGIYNGSLREVELVTEEEKSHRLTNRFSKLVERYPICTIRGTSINVWPKTITPLSILYYRKPTTPYLDYYINSNDRETVLAVGTSHLLTTNEEGSEGQTAGTTVNSLTVELSYHEDLHMKYVYKILSMLGVRINYPQLVQYSEAMQQKSKEE